MVPPRAAGAAGEEMSLRSSAVDGGRGGRGVTRGPENRPSAGVVAGFAALAAMVVLQVASGMAEDAAGFVNPIVGVMAASAICFAAAARGRGRALAAFAAAALVGYLAEAVGESTGLPFGAYRYTGVLWPEAGPVPLTVCVAWGGMGLAAYGVAGAISRRWAVGLGAAALTAWDLFLDPQMVRLGLWTWAEAGPYRGVPLTNYAGWFLVSLLVMAVIRGTLGAPGRIRGLPLLYAVMAAMETLAFATVFEPRDPLVAAVGGVAMGGFAAAAWWRARKGASARAGAATRRPLPAWARARAGGRVPLRPGPRGWARAWGRSWRG